MYYSVSLMLSDVGYGVRRYAEERGGGGGTSTSATSTCSASALPASPCVRMRNRGTGGELSGEYQAVSLGMVVTRLFTCNLFSGLACN